MTLRELLEEENHDYRWLSQGYSNGSHQHWWFAGHAKMCRMLLNRLDDKTLDMPVTLKEDA